MATLASEFEVRLGELTQEMVALAGYDEACRLLSEALIETAACAGFRSGDAAAVLEAYEERKKRGMKGAKKRAKSGEDG